MQPQIIPFNISFCSAEKKESLEKIETFPDQKITVMELEKTPTAKRLISPKTPTITEKLILDNEKEQRE